MPSRVQSEERLGCGCCVFWAHGFWTLACYCWCLLRHCAGSARHCLFLLVAMICFCLLAGMYCEQLPGHRTESGPDSGVGTPECLFPRLFGKFPRLCMAVWKTPLTSAEFGNKEVLAKYQFARLACFSRLPDCFIQSGYPTVECPTVSPTLFGGQK